MTATVSHCPRVSEWVYVGDTAINMAQVASIAFGGDAQGAYALVRLAAGEYQYEVREPLLLHYLRAYVAQMLAPGVERAGQR